MLEYVKAHAHQPWSALSALIFPFTGGALAASHLTPESVTIAVVLALLGGATAWFHWTESYHNWSTPADHGTIIATVAAILVHSWGLGWVTMAMAAVAGVVLGVVTWKTDRLNYRWIVGVLGVGTLVGTVVNGSPVEATIALAVLGLSFLAREEANRLREAGRLYAYDVWHGFGWHWLADFSFILFFLGVVS